ncbi:hypothetical protein ACXZ1M_14340 [Duganella sp. PWIR1]
MKNIKLLMFAVFAAMATGASGHTSIALIEQQPAKSWFSSSNYASQKEADNDALEGCRVTARQRGIADLAKQCKTVARAIGPGFGAMVCAEGGCSWSMGHDSAQDAIDAAYQSCTKNYGNCQDKEIPFWEDRKGYLAKPVAQKLQPPSDCRPRTSHLECTSKCTNGSCVVKYKNGCQLEVQVQQQFNPISNSWDYPAPSC